MATPLTILITAVGAILVFELGKELFRRFSDKRHNRYFQAGFNQAVNHIYKQVTQTGKINVKLDDKELTLVAFKKEEKNRGRNN